MKKVRWREDIMQSSGEHYQAGYRADMGVLEGKISGGGKIWMERKIKSRNSSRTERQN